MLALSGMGHSEDTTSPEDHVLDLGRGLRTVTRNRVILGVNPNDYGCTDYKSVPEIDWGPGAAPDPTADVLDALDALVRTDGQVEDSDNDSADEQGAEPVPATTDTASPSEEPPVEGLAPDTTETSAASQAPSWTSPSTYSFVGAPPSSGAASTALDAKPVDFDELAAHP